MEPNPYDAPRELCEPGETPHRRFSSPSLRLLRIGIALILVAAPTLYWAFFVYTIPRMPPVWYVLTSLLSVAMILVGFIAVVISGVWCLVSWAFRGSCSQRPPNP
jgi:hypothetical protein